MENNEEMEDTATNMLFKMLLIESLKGNDFDAISKEADLPVQQYMTARLSLILDAMKDIVEDYDIAKMDQMLTNVVMTQMMRNLEPSNNITSRGESIFNNRSMLDEILNSLKKQADRQSKN